MYKVTIRLSSARFIYLGELINEPGVLPVSGGMRSRPDLHATDSEEEMNEEVTITTQDITERLTIATKRGPKLNDNAAIKACCEKFTAFMADNREIYIIIKKEDMGYREL